MSNMTIHEQEAVSKAAKLLTRLGASEVFVFGSAVKGQLRPNSDIDMAVSGLPALVYFSAISQASDLIGRPVDLVDAFRTLVALPAASSPSADSADPAY